MLLLQTSTKDSYKQIQSSINVSMDMELLRFRMSNSKETLRMLRQLMKWARRMHPATVFQSMPDMHLFRQMYVFIFTSLTRNKNASENKEI